MERDGWKCRRCSNDQITLNVHHLKYFPDRDPWDYSEELLVTLCEDCHNKEHQSKVKTREILPWPLVKVGDEQFFGYPTVIGFHAREDEGRQLPFACFIYGDVETVYMLPDDFDLFKELSEWVIGNFATHFDPGICCKLHVKKTELGYQVDQP